MPEDERPPAPAHLTGPEWCRLLLDGELEVEGRMPWSSNATFLVTVRAGDLEFRAIYKPAAGERPLWDFPTGLYRREVAAYRLSEATGLPLVPETVLREDAPFGEGSLQRFIDADFSQHYFTLLEDEASHDVLRSFAGFDVLANNADRKGGHLLVDGEGRVWGIDHGLCFHRDSKLRTVAWDFAGEPVPDAVLNGAVAIASSLPADLEELLSGGEAEALRRRARELLERPVLPAPERDERCYPWPLV
ncbi:MAG: phosphatidylinositol kinase [Acidimicrobiaceae bacterium]|nr:phosphatidylinositol kinase [Acidimicrobiaceae bacterium]